MGEVLVDCEAGRALGCATYCCRLIVRLDDEDWTLTPEGRRKHCLDKSPEGLCVHLDPTTHRCGIWETRPKICKGFDCNRDPLLQIVLRDGYTNLVTLVTAPEVPREAWRRIPTLEP